jgi:tetratricopeptide (TPR) repeat protein
VSDDRRIEALLEQADLRMQMRDYRAAIDLLREALALDPDHARGHAILALALVGAKRLPGAAIEMRMALALDGNSSLGHYVAAYVLEAQRDVDAAWQHIQIALEADSTDVDTYVLGASICSLRDDRARARELLRSALALEPSHVGALVAFARVELDDRRLDDAERYAAEALRARPGDLDAHVIAGYVALVRGDAAGAEEHARFALGQESTDRGALQLWAAIKAHRSWTLGVWWRFNAYVSLRSESGQIGLLLGSFVVVQLAIILVGAAGWPTLERVLQYVWLGFCGYTWFAPELFKKLLARDLGRVELDPDF